MDEFWQELMGEELHFRDIWQFEIKTDLVPNPHKKSHYIQEFYIFIPNSLQINEETYPKEHFYQDQTNLIRYKTPEFSFRELLDGGNPRSPLTKIAALLLKNPTEENIHSVKDELKLFANIVRSALRKEVRSLIEEMDHPQEFSARVATFCKELNSLHNHYIELEKGFARAWKVPEIDQNFAYIDEFISTSYNLFLTGLLDHMRRHQSRLLSQADKAISELLVKEKILREREHQEPRKIHERSSQSATVLYRAGLLNKFVMDALMLDSTRTSIQRKYGNIISSIAAGVAMLIYLLLFIWQGQIFVITSAPFVILTVVAYVIKDRLKESLKTLSYQKAFKFFSDYSTKVRTLETRKVLGVVKESFSFLNEASISNEIRNIREKGFHNVLEGVKRPEQVIYYKKEVEIYPARELKERRTAWNIIFRFNILRFLTKASDPYDTYLNLDPETLKLNRTLLPKVYHINVVLKNTFYIEGETPQAELKKIRLIIDKEGIKHIEQIT